MHASINKAITPPRNALFITIEILINLSLLFEVCLRMISLRKVLKSDYHLQLSQKYFRAKSNVFDLVVLILSLLSLIIYFAATGVIGEAEDITATLLVTFRYVMQFLRLALLVKK